MHKEFHNSYHYKHITMKTATIILYLSTLSSMANAATELSVTVYEGPTECDEANTIKVGDYVHMHYTGTIDESSESGEKGSKFDSSRDLGQTFDFKIGQGAVIKGWDEGLIGLCKGAKATLIIPPDMGYGKYGAGEAIPGGATLNFDVEVVEVTDKEPELPNFFTMLDVDGDGRLSRAEIEAFFTNRGETMPDGLWEDEDKNGDGWVDWHEFKGPKGKEPPVREEL